MELCRVTPLMALSMALLIPSSKAYFGRWRHHIITRCFHTIVDPESRAVAYLAHLRTGVLNIRCVTELIPRPCHAP